MTPYELNILLHYHCYKTEFHRYADNTFYRNTISQLVADGLIERLPVPFHDGATLQLTEKGTFYVTEGLCKVPMPEPRFTIPWKVES